MKTLLHKPVFCCHFITLLIAFCFLEAALSEEIKTIDGSVFTGEIIEMDESNLTFIEGENNIISLQWRIIELIIKDSEIIMISHGKDKNTFSILKMTGQKNLSAEDLNTESTESLSVVFPEKTATGAIKTVQADVKTGRSDSAEANESADQDTAEGTKLWKGNIDAGLRVRTGNNDVFATTTKMSISREGPINTFLFNSLLQYEVQDGEKNTDEQRGSFKYERRMKKKLYVFLQESLEHDDIEKLNLRSITSSGAGYRFIESKTINYKSEIGSSLTYERFRDNVTKKNLGVRIGNYFEWQFSELTYFYFKVDYLPNLEDREDWRLESDTGIRHKINKHLSWNFSWVNDYDSKPQGEDVKNNDATLLSSIGYNF